MRKNIYSVFDAKSSLFINFFVSESDGVAIRSLQDALTKQDSIYAKHPEDYSLWALGFFNDEKGSFENIVPPKNLVNCSALITVRTLEPGQRRDDTLDPRNSR